MDDSQFERISAYFDQPGQLRTNNSAERYARKIKKIQKSRYRLRTKATLDQFMRLEVVLSGSPLRFEEMDSSFDVIYSQR